MMKNKIENVASALNKISFANNGAENASSPESVLSNSIDVIFESLKDVNLKRKSVKLLEQTYKMLPSETQLAVFQKIQEKVDSPGKYVLMKQILDLLNGPPNVRKLLETSLQEICQLALGTIRNVCEIADPGAILMEEVNKDILDTEIFNALKICVSIFQNYGNDLIKYIFENQQSETWQGAWTQELVSKLLTIVKNKILQKEILSLAATALAHIVNSLPSLQLSLQLACLMLKITRKDATINENIGPLTVEVNCCVAEDSMLREIVAYNGLLSVCSPYILLSDVAIETMNGPIILQTLSKTLKACSASNNSVLKYSSFQVLNNWMECVARISMPVYHSQIEDKEMLFQQSSRCCNDLLSIIWNNREEMIDGVSKLVLTIFKKLIELHVSERNVLGMAPDKSELFDEIAMKLLKDPWYVKGRYSLLCELLPHFNSREILRLHPSLPSEICKCYGTSTLPSVANECYRVFIGVKPTSSPSQKVWTPGYWKSVWMELFMSLLTDENTRSMHNALLYFIPTTLQLVNGIFELLRDAVSQALDETNNTADDDSCEASSLRSKLLFGYCSIFKLGRKLGLASISDIDATILKEGLRHVNDDVRVAAFSVLCHNAKTTEPISEFEEALLLDFLSVNLNCASSSFRQSLFVALKVFLARIRDSCVMMLRNFKKEEKRKPNDIKDVRKMPDRLKASINLVEKIVSLSIRNVFPGASFQRRKTGLQMLYSVLEIFLSPTDAVKKGRTVESLQSLIDWISKTGKWQFLTIENLKIIMTCFEDQHDEIRELALTITNWFNFEKIKFEDNEKNQFGKNIFMHAATLISSPKIRDAESGAILMEFVARRFSILDDDFVCKEDLTGLTKGKLLNAGSCTNIIQIVEFLLCKMRDDIQSSHEDILHAAVHRPVFGHTLAARRCFIALLDRIRGSPPSASIVDDFVKTLADLSNKAVQTSIFAIQTALSIFSKRKEGCPEDSKGTSPSFADINEALGRKLCSCTSFSELKDTIGYQHCLELLSSFCWLNVKAASLFLGDVAKIWGLDFLSFAQRKIIISNDLIQVTGRIFKETLINCRHKGVIENSCTGFQRFCKSLSSSSSNVEILNDWLHKTIDACDKNDMNSSITKRSAGLPMYVQSIISSCVTSPSFSIAKYMKWLIEIAKRPLPGSGNLETDLPQVQAMNILRGIYRDSSIGAEVLQFAEDGVMLAVEGFASPSWSIRNAAQILFGALVPRMLGQKVTQADKSHHNSVSPDQFFFKYPQLENFFLKYLRIGVDCKNETTLLPALVPILTFLSNLRPCENERYSLVFFPLLDNLLSSSVITVRNLASSCLVTFVSRNSMSTFTNQTILKIVSSNLSSNYVHGLLLVIKKILNMAEDEAELRDVVLTKGILPHLDALLLFKHGKSTEYLTRSNVFEIASIIISILQEIPTEFSTLFKDRLFHALKKQVLQINSRNYLSQNDQQIGYCLYLKRFAKAVFDFIVNTQHHCTDEAFILLDGLLSSSPNRLETNFLHELTHHLDQGGYFSNELKCRTARTLEKCLLSNYKEHDIIVYWNCWCALKIDAKTLDEKTVSLLFGASSEILSSGCPHRTLAACLPFIGSLLSSVCKAMHSCTTTYKNAISVMSTWSERVYAGSAADKREILRVSSVKSVKNSAKSIMMLYKDNDSNDHDIDLICARIILTSLRLVQDEDEAIRKQASSIASLLHPAFNGNQNKQSPLQTNLALRTIFDFISMELWGNIVLLKELFAVTEEIYRKDELMSFGETDRKLMLFEQESANLFAEDFILSTETINCLTKCCQIILKNDTNEANKFQDELKVVLNRVEQDYVVVLRTLVDSVEGQSKDERNPDFSGNSRMFLALYTCLALGCLLQKFQDSTSQGKDDTLRILQRITKENYHPLLVEEANRVTKLMNPMA